MAFEKFFFFWMPMNIENDWKAKLESAYSFMFKYSEITVCYSKRMGFSFNFSSHLKKIQFMQVCRKIVLASLHLLL